MIELRVLGPMSFGASDERQAEALMRQQRRAALLAYLAAARPRGAHSRDKLLALFWPESDDTHARAALSQAIYTLRSILGEDAIVSRGPAIGVSHDLVWCDAVAFDDALDEGRPADALALYRGDLLDGFHIAGAPEFERWVDEERNRIRQRAVEGAWALAESRADDGNVLEAARWARRAGSLLPADEASVRRLMTFLHGLGDRAAAIQAYEAFAWALMNEYELEPSAETRELADSIRGGIAIPRANGNPRPPQSNDDVREAPRRQFREHGRLAAVVVGAVALLGLAVASLGGTDRGSAPVVRFGLDLGGVPIAGGISGSTLALSPDGRELIYVGQDDVGRRLFRRSMDRLDALPIPNTDGAQLPFLSPDGAWLGFVIGNTLHKVRLAGGSPIRIWDAGENIPGASWGPGGTIVFATPAGLWRVPAGGGTAQLIAAVDTLRRERYRWPHILPSGRAAVFTMFDTSGFELAAVSLQNGTVTPLGIEGTSPVFVPPRHLIFGRANGALLSVGFDPATLRVTDAPVPLGDGVVVGIAGAVKFSLSASSALAFIPQSLEHSLVIVDRSGKEQNGPEVKGVFHPRFSPDGNHIAVSVNHPHGGLADISVVDLRSSTHQRITSDSASITPTWSPDGGWIAFASKPGGRLFGWSIHRGAVGDTSVVETLLPPVHAQMPTGFTPDGSALVFHRSEAGGNVAIWVLRLSGERDLVPYTVGSANEWGATISPDGRRLAFVSDVSGRQEVYVGGFPLRGAPMRVSAGGGREPRWGADGREIFYRSARGMVAVALENGDRLRVITRTGLFDDRAFLSAPRETAYDVHPDGQRFAMIRRGPGSNDIVIVLNLLEELGVRRR